MRVDAISTSKVENLIPPRDRIIPNPVKQYVNTKINPRNICGSIKGSCPEKNILIFPAPSIFNASVSSLGTLFSPSLMYLINIGEL